MLISNPTGWTQYIKHGANLGRACTAEAVSVTQASGEMPREEDPPEDSSSATEGHVQDTVEATNDRPTDGEQLLTESSTKFPAVQQVTALDKDLQRRKALLQPLLKEDSYLGAEEQTKVYNTVMERCEAFALAEGEHGQTDLRLKPVMQPL